MERCLQLAQYGAGYVSPNPMVGAVIVHNDMIIGEGYHRQYGEPHAEPNAIRSVKETHLLKDSTMYVSLEPCSHYGKTPPCTDLIVSKGIPRVVIGSPDPNPKVAGRGIKKLQDAGIQVITGIMEKECRELNKHFFTFQEKKRPYITLKWAQTTDGFIDIQRKNADTAPIRISNELTSLLVHKMRAENQAILVGTNTARLDNPSLTVRKWSGTNPNRIVLDRTGNIRSDLRVFNGETETFIYTETSGESRHNVEYITLNFNQETILETIIEDLAKRNINSLLVEGGAKLLNSFIEKGLWDEARVEIAPTTIGTGVTAPVIASLPIEEKTYQRHKCLSYRNNDKEQKQSENQCK